MKTLAKWGIVKGKEGAIGPIYQKEGALLIELTLGMRGAEEVGEGGPEEKDGG